MSAIISCCPCFLVAVQLPCRSKVCAQTSKELASRKMAEQLGAEHTETHPLTKPRVIEWKDIDKSKFFVWGPTVFSCVRVLTHPGMCACAQLQPHTVLLTPQPSYKQFPLHICFFCSHACQNPPSGETNGSSLPHFCGTCLCYASTIRIHQALLDKRHTPILHCRLNSIHRT